MLDAEWADRYDVDVKHLKRQVRRNTGRFPGDCLPELSHEEYRAVRCQMDIIKMGRPSKHRPYAVTAQGIAMLSSVLKLTRAIEVNIAILRTVIRLREMIRLE